MDIRSYMAQVPEMDRFLTVDELHAGLDRLAEEFPEVARVRRVGTSSLGEPIRMLSVGDGPHHALLFGCPHPNEPIGAMMLHHLGRLLCEDAAVRDAFGYTWHLIPSVDPDGTRLNEGWFSPPFSPTSYARHFYRPAGRQQVEWTFPVSYKDLWFDQPLPETLALMRVIDETKPELIVSLHNAGFGGVYYYLTRAAEPLYPVLHAIPEWEDLPLSLGEPEVPFITPLAPAIFPGMHTADIYDYIAENGGDPVANATGTSSSEYAAPYNSFSLVTEVAYYDDPRVQDQTVTEVNRRDAILAGLDLFDEATAEMRRHLDAVSDQLKGDSPFEVSSRWWVETVGQSRDAQRTWAKTDPSTDRPATVAECFSSDVEVQFYRLLGLGTLVRMLEGQIAIGNGTPAIRTHLREARETFDAWGNRLESALDYRVVPIRKLVAVQLGAALATAEYLASQRPG